MIIHILHPRSLAVRRGLVNSVCAQLTVKVNGRVERHPLLQIGMAGAHVTQRAELEIVIVVGRSRRQVLEMAT